MARYQFTDTDLAARRLQVLATVYEASSREFIRRFSGHTVERAVDLGCGPGYTTELVRDETRAKSVVGLDNSEKFVAEARKRGLDRVTFHTHDVTSTPFPTGPSDVMYCRYLLSHLPDLPNCLTLWSSQLRPGGVLLIEEVEEIHTSVGTLEVYLAAR